MEIMKTHGNMPMGAFEVTWHLASGEYFEQGKGSMKSTWHELIEEFLNLNFKFRFGFTFWSTIHYK